jgi:hypothetical protein
MKRQGYLASVAAGMTAWLASSPAWAAASGGHLSQPNLLLLLVSAAGGIFWAMARRRKGVRR